MMKNKEKLYKLVSECIQSNVEDLIEEKNFSEYVDSLSFIRILIEVEEMFGLDIPEEDLSFDKFSNIKDLYEYIVEHSR